MTITYTDIISVIIAVVLGCLILSGCTKDIGCALDSMFGNHETCKPTQVVQP